MIIKKSANVTPPIAEGTYHAICYGVVDLGTQSVEYPYKSGQYKNTRQIRIYWEIPELRIQLEKNGNKVDLPKVISRTYTNSLDEKSNLFKNLTSWRGKSFTDEELRGFEVYTILGANCLLQIMHNKNGYAGVSNVTPIIKGMEKKKPENPILKYDMSCDGFVLSDSLYDKLKETIMKSTEYQAVEHARQTLGVGHTEQADTEEEWGDPADAANANSGDDLPF